jgi:uncharacterized protein (DUF1501 family)
MMKNASRREFMKRVSALSLAGSAAPLAFNLAAISEAAAAVQSDYKALVCVFLYGGNDHANTLIPFDNPSHAAYQRFRPVLGLDQAALTATALPALAGGRQYALAPELAPLKPLFDEKALAVMLNIGTLIQPTRKADYLAKRVALPRNLFSHNDQQSFWQSGEVEGAPTGWGGRMADLFFQSANSGSLFTCLNASGNAVFLSGEQVLPYRLYPTGPIAIQALTTPLAGSAACSSLLQSLIQSSRGNYFQNEHAAIVRRSVEASSGLTDALSPTPNFEGVFPAENPLASQLKIVARSIACSAELGLKRQVFFVGLGGFDNHDGLATAHPQLLSMLAQALAAFHRATKELGVADKVTTFTGSDFGRSWGNADGSDHGWGSFHFVLGGAVKGGRFYGTAPEIADNGPDDIGNGRLLPSFGMDPFAATLGKWMGLNDSQLQEVLPNLKNFAGDPRDLRFV